MQSFPRKVLPPRALVIAVTPLLDDRSVAVLVELRRRGYDVTALEVSPLALVGRDRANPVVDQLWQLRRDAQRARLRAMGLATSAWSDEVPLGAAIEEVNRFRRSMLRAARA